MERPTTTTCDGCGQLFEHEDMHHDEAGSWCESCREKQLREGALAAGIPLSVVEGRSKLTDHFSKEYIRSQTHPKEGGAS